eukprot:CAMPEP_0194446750 /NCGR_PEP_ID=MMETSP0176-20130528/128614_1 /TAXON_ID=216777 /ORGANISM="Proboscia alata, Strain PI-D3" /LENGTH=733 /DNA_ID=CAMNT_0039273509 /DNA_START=370 /DNA_END=2570 /DNA_ORIENTATION=-
MIMLLACALEQHHSTTYSSGRSSGIVGCWGFQPLHLQHSSPQTNGWTRAAGWGERATTQKQQHTLFCPPFVNRRIILNTDENYIRLERLFYSRRSDVRMSSSATSEETESVVATGHGGGSNRENDTTSASTTTKPSATLSVTAGTSSETAATSSTTAEESVGENDTTSVSTMTKPSTSLSVTAGTSSETAATSSTTAEESAKKNWFPSANVVHGTPTSQVHPFSVVNRQSTLIVDDIASPTINDSSTSTSNSTLCPTRTDLGGYTHTNTSRSKISSANKGKVPWNRGRKRSKKDKERISTGVRAQNRAKFLAKLAEMNMTETQYLDQKRKKEERKLEEKNQRRTENGGYKLSEETRAKISVALREKWKSGTVKPRCDRKNSTSTSVFDRTGVRHTEETKEKIRNTLRMKWSTNTTFREKMMGNGNPSSNMTSRERISNTLKEKWQDPEFRAYMLKSMEGRYNNQGTVASASHREKISNAMRKKWQDPDYRQKALDGMAKIRPAAMETRRRNRPPSIPRPPRVPKVRVPRTPKAARAKRPRAAKKVKVKKTATDAPPKETAAEKRANKKEMELKNKMSSELKRRLRMKEKKPDLYDLLYGEDGLSDEAKASAASPLQQQPTTTSAISLVSPSTIATTSEEKQVDQIFQPQTLDEIFSFSSVNTNEKSSLSSNGNAEDEPAQDIMTNNDEGDLTLDGSLESLFGTLEDESFLDDVAFDLDAYDPYGLENNAADSF